MKKKLITTLIFLFLNKPRWSLMQEKEAAQVKRLMSTCPYISVFRVVTEGNGQRNSSCHMWSVSCKPVRYLYLLMTGKKVGHAGPPASNPSYMRKQLRHLKNEQSTGYSYIKSSCALGLAQQETWSSHSLVFVLCFKQWCTKSYMKSFVSSKWHPATQSLCSITDLMIDLSLLQ